MRKRYKTTNEVVLLSNGQILGPTWDGDDVVRRFSLHHDNIVDSFPLKNLIEDEVVGVIVEHTFWDWNYKATFISPSGNEIHYDNNQDRERKKRLSEDELKIWIEVCQKISHTCIEWYKQYIVYFTRDEMKVICKIAN